MLDLILEYDESDLNPLSSFKTHTKFNSKVWGDKDVMDSNIRKALLKVAKEFINNYIGYDLEFEDIVLVGSLANFNYSKYSDFDVHIIIDFKKINKDVELVKGFLNSQRLRWNQEHNINIKGYKIELYCQDIKEENASEGVFSILNNKWVVKPEYNKDYKVSDNVLNKVEEASIARMVEIDSLTDDDYDKSYKILKDIFKVRKSSLKSDGELGVGNLVYKLLKRNGYIDKLLDLINVSFDSEIEGLVECNCFKLREHNILNEAIDYENKSRQNKLEKKQLWLRGKRIISQTD